MALQDNVVSIDFGQGLDTKTDPKLVVPGKFITLQNGVFTNSKRVSKRNGYDSLTLNIVGGGTIASPTMSKSFNNELVVAGTASGASVFGQRLFSYSPSLSGWVDRGKYLSVAVSKQSISSYSPYLPAVAGTLNTSTAFLGNIALVVYTVPTASNTTQVYLSALDTASGSYYAHDLLVPGAFSSAKAVLLGGTQLAVIYWNSGTSKIAGRTVTVSLGAGVVFGSEVVIDSLSAAVPCFDLLPTSTGCAISYWVGTGTTLHTKTLDTALTTTHAVFLSSVGTPSPISVSTDASNNIWVYWADSTSVIAESISYIIYSSTLGAVLGQTSIGVSITGAINQIAAISSPTIANQQDLYYSILNPGHGTYQNTYSIIYRGSTTLGGVADPGSPWLYNVDIYSKPINLNSTQYMAVMFYSALFPTGFLIDLLDAKPVAKFLADQAEGINTDTVGLAVRSPGFINPLYQLSSTKIILNAGSINPGGLITQVQSSSATGNPSIIPRSVSMGSSLVTFDFSHIDSYQSVIQQDLLALNGGFISQYDGSSVSELGFSYDPDGISASVAGAGAIAAGSYVYYAVYQWTDSQGNLNQSAPSSPFLVSPSAGSKTITITVQTLSMTQKTGVTVAVYRTTDAGVIAYLVGTAAMAQGTQYVQIVDAASDATIRLFPTLYTEGNAILENIAPPPSMILWSNNNRLWCVDSENPETKMEYSKTASQGSGISFSTGQLELVIDSKAGNITGVSPMDEKTVVLKQDGLGYFIGDGANDAGGQSSITSFQFVPSDVGCTNSKSVVLFPNGILFRSPKGIYLINRGVQCGYFGLDVEAYNSQDILSAFIVPNKNQIRFLTSSGSSLLYDYVFNQWSTFTNHTGLSATAYGGLYTYVRTDGLIYQENEISFLDSATAYRLVMQTAWLSLSSVQNFERVRSSLMLGDYENGTSALHGVSIQAAYDFSTTFSPATSYYFGSASSSAAFQYRNFFSRQKCDSLTLLISELTSGNMGEYLNFSNMSLIAAVKLGGNKVSAKQSVG